MTLDAAIQVLRSAAPFLSPIVAAIGLAFAYYQWRKTQLRRDDVLKWANEVISTLETIYLLCLLKTSNFDKAALDKRLSDAVFDTAILVEKGRLFFKNAKPKEYGTHKMPAYRGYRPTILDPIVVAHQVALALAAANEDTRLRMTLVAEDALKKFVSLAQKEIGRQRTVAAETRKGGDGQHLRKLLDNVSKDRLDQLKANREH